MVGKAKERPAHVKEGAVVPHGPERDGARPPLQISELVLFLWANFLSKAGQQDAWDV